MAKKSEILKPDDLSLRKDHRNIKFNNFAISHPSNPDMFVCQSGHKSLCEPGWHTKLSTYDHYIIHYVLSGKGIYHAPTKSYPIKKGDLFLIKPFESIHYQADFLEPWTYYWVGFNGHDVWKKLKLSGFDDNALVRSYSNDNRLEDIFRNLAYPQLISTAREYELLGSLYQMFSLLIHTHGHHAVSKSEQYLTQALEYIQENYPFPIKVSDIASSIGIDRTYLYRLFHESFQLSVQDFILDFRLKKARSLLKYSDSSISLIASSCGFENLSYFSNIFKKKYGQTPLQYRKNESQKSIDALQNTSSLIE